MWSHRVTVIVPKVLKYTNVAISWLTGECNEHPNEKPNSFKDVPDLVIGDEFAKTSGTIAITV